MPESNRLKRDYEPRGIPNPPPATNLRILTNSRFRVNLLYLAQNLGRGMEQIAVVAAVIVRDGKILVAKKRSDQGRFTAGKWEFPGGKIEGNESHVDALIREIGEELRLQIEVKRHLATTSHLYDGKITIQLFVYLCKPTSDLEVLEHETVEWVTPAELYSLDLSPADAKAVPAIVEAVRDL